MAKNKIQTVRKVWISVGLWVMLIFFLLLSYEHQKVGNGRSIISSIEETLESRYIQTINEAGEAEAGYTFEIGVKDLRNLEDLKNWFTQLFSFYAQEDYYELNNGEVFEGNYFTGINYMITDRYRFTIRKKTIMDADNSEFNRIAERTLSKSFDPADDDPEGEFKETIVGEASGKEFEYTPNSGYLNKGGYVKFVRVEDLIDEVPIFVEEGFIDKQMNSMVVDFITMQITTKNIVYVSIIFTLDDAFNVNT
eukprot:CAMPEP_0114579002 /NCGR_PEP_ID=MMETSP0125-20121206/3465_1 /TAXON_ID=485358 ORGANISM="Aristerostoma sp., Strain ATCC 50986" /NCGR_SAMPLE_ID=MMETSP0125 /ASSEMBLY_ACC=CAM_ASM_000245 /LENGTH=250 /DNA_ID=CAMNT_0001769483 /DNA_START=2027 /DNA_END=2779 /DNA_ORIENTATION=-